jgi:hypothetical protein
MLGSGWIEGAFDFEWIECVKLISTKTESNIKWFIFGYDNVKLSLNNSMFGAVIIDTRHVELMLPCLISQN